MLSKWKEMGYYNYRSWFRHKVFLILISYFSEYMYQYLFDIQMSENIVFAHQLIFPHLFYRS